MLKAKELNCMSEILTAVSMLSSDSVFVMPHRKEDRTAAGQAHKSFSSPHGDLVTLVNVYMSWIKANKDRKHSARDNRR